MSLSIGIFGTGRLGGLVADACAQADDVSLAWAVGRDAPLVDLDTVDVAIDVSHADAVANHLAWARESSVPLILGVTGWPASLIDHPGAAPAGAPAVMLAPNFSLSLALTNRLAAVIARYAAATEAAGNGPVDLAVFDRHHRGKVDAPSGTALLLADTLRATSGLEVQVAAQRIGSVIGFHEVRSSNGDESITLSHESHDRALYATGALTAARWLHERRDSGGIRTFDEVADDVLAPLFTPATQPTPTGTTNTERS